MCQLLELFYHICHKCSFCVQIWSSMQGCSSSLGADPQVLFTLRWNGLNKSWAQRKLAPSFLLQCFQPTLEYLPPISWWVSWLYLLFSLSLGYLHCSWVSFSTSSGYLMVLHVFSKLGTSLSCLYFVSRLLGTIWGQIPR